jgi:hypothetical protein
MLKIVGALLLILGAAGTALRFGSAFLFVVMAIYAGPSLNTTGKTLVMGITMQRLVGSLIILLPSLMVAFLGKHLYYKKVKT